VKIRPPAPAVSRPKWPPPRPQGTIKPCPTFDGTDFLWRTPLAITAMNPSSPLLATLLATLLAAFAIHAEQAQAADAPRRIVAVAPLHAAADDPALRQLAASVTDVLSSLLSEDRTLAIVERRRIAEVLSEQKLQASGLVDAATAGRVGRLLGAELVLSGSLVPEKESLRLVLHVIGVAGQEVRGTIDLPLARERVAEDLLSIGPQLAKLTNTTLSPPPAESLDDSPIGRIHLLRGMSCRVAGLPDQAVVHLLRAVRVDPRLVEARIGIARAYLDSGEPDKAALELTRLRSHSLAAQWQADIDTLAAEIAHATAAPIREKR
jgi:TolB-like protein